MPPPGADHGAADNRRLDNAGAAAVKASAGRGLGVVEELPVPSSRRTALRHDRFLQHRRPKGWQAFVTSSPRAASMAGMSGARTCIRARRCRRRGTAGFHQRVHRVGRFRTDPWRFGGLFSDGRYTLQMSNQSDGDHWHALPLPEADLGGFLAGEDLEGARIGIDPRLVTVQRICEGLPSAHRRRRNLSPRKPTRSTPCGTATAPRRRSRARSHAGPHCRQEHGRQARRTG